MDLLTRKVFSHAGEPWEGNSVRLRADLMYINQVWQKLVEENGHDEGEASVCPVSFTEAEIHSTMGVLKEQEETDTQLERIRSFIGITADGWTSNEEYEAAVQRARYIKQQALEDLDSDEERAMTLQHWPFADFDEEGEGP
jgi:hypothetical protein